MENTYEMLFPDNSPVWYVAQGDRTIGPMSPSEIHQKILAQELTLADFIWRTGQKSWQRICDTETFKVVAPPPPPAPKLPSESAKPAVKPASGRRSSSRGAATPPEPAKAEPKTWFLHYNDSQFGPFSKGEVIRFLSVGKIHGRVHAWQDGMEEWKRLESISDFSDAVAAAAEARKPKEKPRAAPPKPPAKPPEKKPEPRESKDQRGAPRRPIVAKILMTDSDSVIVGVCRDISVGGMQVLTDQIPGVAGTRIKLNVSPSGSGKGSQLTPFVAEGVIVRILEDGRGFSFRFDRLPGDAKRAIETYITATG